MSLYRVFDHEGHDDDDYKKKQRLQRKTERTYDVH